MIESSGSQQPENPDESHSGTPSEGEFSSNVQDPDPDVANQQALEMQAEQADILSQAGVSDELIALRDIVAESLQAGPSPIESLSDESAAQSIIGVGFGLTDPENVTFGLGRPGEPSLTLFTRSLVPQQTLMNELTKSAGTQALSSVPVQQVPVGVIDAYSHRARQRPAPGGVSVAHTSVTAGTLGSRAVGQTAPWNNRHLVLSNNHVLANTNAATVGDRIVQPGPVDGGTYPADQVAVLARWVPINFDGPNFVDAAFGWAWHDRVRGEQYYLAGGAPAYYRTGTSALAARLGQLVGKSGRTTGLTQGRVTQIGASVRVNYHGRVALFNNQIAVQSVNSNPFSAGGDSGSLIWDWATGVRPVGLLFAGGGGTTFANPIGSVLAALDVRLLP